jgi:hypothetical protein
VIGGKTIMLALCSFGANASVAATARTRSPVSRAPAATLTVPAPPALSEALRRELDVLAGRLAWMLLANDRRAQFVPSVEKQPVPNYGAGCNHSLCMCAVVLSPFGLPIKGAVVQRIMHLTRPIWIECKHG